MYVRVYVPICLSLQNIFESGILYLNDELSPGNFIKIIIIIVIIWPLILSQHFGIDCIQRYPLNEIYNFSFIYL